MLFTRETDPMLRRFERNQAVATLVMAAIAAALGRFDVALGVIGGGLLMAMSYRAIRGGVEAVVPAGRDDVPRRLGAKRRAWLVAKFIGRYALLALAAYVMLIFLRAHPAGLLAGAASPVVAVAVEALRVARAWSRPHSR
jgi:hypothetical protein